MSFLRMQALALATVMALGANAAAQTGPDPDGFPPRLREIVQTDLQMCREQGATAEMSANHIQTAEFDGDGRLDYLIDQAGMTCPGAPSLYCGDSPCPVYALLSADGFAEPRHIPGDVFEPTVRRQGEISVVETGGVGPDGRDVRLRWMYRGGDWRSAVVRRE